MLQEFLNRLVTDHGSIDLEWLRDVPPDKAKYDTKIVINSSFFSRFIYLIYVYII